MFKKTQYVCVSSVSKFCPTLCNLMDCSPPGSSVHGISQARILEWVAISSSRDMKIMVYHIYMIYTYTYIYINRFGYIYIWLMQPQP